MTAIRPLELSHTMPLTIEPVADVLFTVREIELTVTVNDVLFKGTLVVTSIRESHLAFALFDTILIFAFVAGPIGPTLFALAMLLVTEPLTLILRAILHQECSKTFSLVIVPITIINVSIFMDQLSFSSRFVIEPVTLVATTRQPLVNADSIALSVLPLALIGLSILHLEVRFLDPAKLILLLSLLLLVNLRSISILVNRKSVLIFMNSLMFLELLLYIKFFFRLFHKGLILLELMRFHLIMTICLSCSTLDFLDLW